MIAAFKSFLCRCANHALVVATVAGTCVTSNATANASVLTQWTFETSQPAATDSASISGILAEVGTGTASASHGSSSTDYSNPAGNGSAESFSSNTWTTLGDYYQFSTSTLGQQNITFGWDQTRSSTGPSSFKVEADFGSGFADILNPYTVGVATWVSGSADAGSVFAPISLGAAAANKATIIVRLTSLAAVTNAAGTNRVDNVTIFADRIPAVPEPGSLLTVGGCVLLGAFAAWRKSSKA